MNESREPATWADYRAAVARFTDAIDTVLEHGRAAEKRHDQLRRVHDLQRASGVAIPFDPDNLPPDQRHIQRRVLQLTENLYHTFLGPAPKPRPILATPAARALGSRNRI